MEKELNNHKSKVLDELNRRIEEAEDNEEIEVIDTLKSFYYWYIEKFIV